jgi:hypothetical protein
LASSPRKKNQDKNWWDTICPTSEGKVKAHKHQTLLPEEKTMRFAIVYLLLAVLVDVLLEIFRTENTAANNWIYRKLWNDTMFDCWSLSVPAWRDARRERTDIPGAGNNAGINKGRGHNQSRAGSFRSQPTSTSCSVVSAVNATAAPSRPRNKRRAASARHATFLLPKSPAGRVRSCAGALAWLSR